MSINSRRKGAAGERELARELREYGYTGARRGVQYKGSPDSPDIVGALDGIHIECKRVEKLNVSEAMKQSERDAGELVPIVAHRKNGEKWLVTMKLVDWIELYRGWANGRD